MTTKSTQETPYLTCSSILYDKKERKDCKWYQVLMHDIGVNGINCRKYCKLERDAAKAETCYERCIRSQNQEL